MRPSLLWVNNIRGDKKSGKAVDEGDGLGILPHAAHFNQANIGVGRNFGVDDSVAGHGGQVLQNTENRGFRVKIQINLSQIPYHVKKNSVAPRPVGLIFNELRPNQ